MKPLPVTSVAVISEVTGCSKEAILNACRIHGLPILGGLVGKTANKLPLDFYKTAHEEHAALLASERRQKRAP